MLRFRFEATTRNTKPTTTKDPSFLVASLRKSACGLSDDFLPALALVCLAFSRMSLSNTIPGSHGVMKVVTRAELQNCGAWKRAFQNKCKDHRYYEIVEETLEGDFEHHYLLLEDDSGNARAIQPVFFVRQNLVEGVPGKIRSVVDLVRKTFPHFLTMRVLMVG